MDDHQLLRGTMRWSSLAFIVVAGSTIHPAVGAAQSLCSCSAPSSRLTAIDYVLLGSSTTLLATDWLTSVDIARRRGRETNPLTGPYPSVGQLNTYMALIAIANLSATRISKPSLRRAGWILLTAVEARATLHNVTFGYNLNFRI